MKSIIKVYFLYGLIIYSFCKVYMIGIKFRIENEYNTVLEEILRDVDSIKYKWCIFDDEVYISSGESLFDNDEYSNQDFKKIISENNYYPVFATVQLYLENGKIVEIENYSQFTNSDCQLILMITDNEFVEVYAKEKIVLETIHQNVLNHSFTDIKLINEPKDISNRFFASFD